jgi:CRP-like cAMP-binding protein
MMCFVTGKVKSYKDGVGGRSQIIRLIKPIDIFGYRAFFAKEPYLTSASTIESSSAYLVPMQVVEQIIQSNNKLALYFIQSLASDLGVDDARIVSLTQKHVRGRLAESLIMLRDNYGVESDGKTINSHLSREDLANYSNMTTSNAIRTLSNFVSEGVIAVSGRNIQILDEEQLRKISKIG